MSEHLDPEAARQRVLMSIRRSGLRAVGRASPERECRSSGCARNLFENVGKSHTESLHHIESSAFDNVRRLLLLSSPDQAHSQLRREGAEGGAGPTLQTSEAHS
jgi:hypothetical protein